MPAGDIDREIFGRLMEGPHALYQSSHDKVRAQGAERAAPSKTESLVSSVLFTATRRQPLNSKYAYYQQLSIMFPGLLLMRIQFA